MPREKENFSFRISRELRKWLEDKAERDRRSMGVVCEMALEAMRDSEVPKRQRK